MTHLKAQGVKTDSPEDFCPHLSVGRSRAAIFGVVWSSLHSLIPTLSATAVFFISAHFLSPSDFGLVGLASGFVSFAIAFSPLAFGEALVQRQVISRAHTDSVFWLAAIFSAVLFAAFLITAHKIAALVGQPAMAALLPVLALRIPFELLAAVPNAMIIRSMRFKLIALRTAVATVVSGVISVVMLLNGYGLWALVVAQVSASFVICVMAFWVAGWRPGLGFRLSVLRDLATYGVFASGNRMLNALRLDHIILGTLGGTYVLGLYFFAQRLYMMMTALVSGALSSVSLALLSTLQGDMKKTREAYLMASFVSSAFSMPLFAGLALIVDDLLPFLFDPKWSGAAFAVQAFCALGILACIGVVQSALIKSQGRADWWFYYQLAQQATTATVIFAVFPYGLEPMMMALVAKSYLIWSVSVVMSARLLGFTPVEYLSAFGRPVLATVVMCAAVIIIKTGFPDLGAAPALGVQVLAGVAVYSVAILALSYDRFAHIRNYLVSKGSLTA